MRIGIRSTNDLAFKKIFGSPENARALISLLNAILGLEKPIVRVTIANPFSQQDFLDDKLSILDTLEIPTLEMRLLEILEGTTKGTHHLSFHLSFWRRSSQVVVLSHVATGTALSPDSNGLPALGPDYAFTAVCATCWLVVRNRIIGFGIRSDEFARKLRQS